MSKKKLFLGVLLIFISISTLFISIIPSAYSSNSAGKIYKKVETNFDFLEKSTSPYVLLYFGYVGCTTICKPALSEINNIYGKLDNKKFTFYFINLQENIPEEFINSYVKSLNKEFNGVYLETPDIKNIISKLNVKYVPSRLNDFDIDHSSFLHVLKKNEDNKYEQIFLYTTRPFNIDFIIEDLNKI